MSLSEILFWFLVIIVLYTYVGYGAAVLIIGGLKRLFFQQEKAGDGDYEPSVTLFVASYNEEQWVERKIRNSMELEYGTEKLSLLWITDGSDDGSADLIRKSPRVVHLHSAERRGKAAAINRGMRFVRTEFVVFSDANALLSPGAIREMVRPFRDPMVGCVSGEKRVSRQARDTATAAGEGTYWRYESWLKKQEAELGSCVSAAGELFAIRCGLFRDLEEDTLIDDFVISMGVALRGHRVLYAPEAYAVETASVAVSEEFKRKTRIAAGNLQALLRMPELLNPLKHGMLTFQYLSHKFLRSLVVPFCLVALIPVNLLVLPKGGFPYSFVFLLQTLFYGAAWAGYAMRESRLTSRMFFVPCYIVIMNLAALVGAFRYLTGRQSILWEKAIRKEEFLEREGGEG